MIDIFICFSLDLALAHIRPLYLDPFRFPTAGMWFSSIWWRQCGDPIALQPIIDDEHGHRSSHLEVSQWKGGCCPFPKDKLLHVIIYNIITLLYYKKAGDTTYSKWIYNEQFVPGISKSTFFHICMQRTCSYVYTEILKLVRKLKVSFFYSCQGNIVSNIPRTCFTSARFPRCCTGGGEE